MGALSMKFFKFFVLLFSILPASIFAMELQKLNRAELKGLAKILQHRRNVAQRIELGIPTLTELTIPELKDLAETLNEQRNAIFENALESGEIYRIISNTMKNKPGFDSIELKKMIVQWKAFPITRQLIKIQNQYNALTSSECLKNKPLQDNELVEFDKAILLSCETFAQSIHDNSQYYQKIFQKKRERNRSQSC